MDEKIRQEIIKRYKEKTAKECSYIYIDSEEPEILDNKIYGNPYLPVGEEYPKDSQGNFMPLLLQVNLKHVDLKYMPNKGILEVFISTSIEKFEYKVLYFDEGKEYQTDLPKFNLSLENFFFEKSLKIDLEKAMADMPLDDYRSYKILNEIVNEVCGKNFKGLSEAEEFLGIEDLQYEIYNDLDLPLACIGGYANFTQSDPRDYEEGQKGLDECLFMIDSCLDNEQINIVDCGIIWGLISKGDLKAGKFENTQVGFDFC